MTDEELDFKFREIGGWVADLLTKLHRLEKDIQVLQTKVARLEEKE